MLWHKLLSYLAILVMPVALAASHTPPNPQGGDPSCTGNVRALLQGPALNTFRRFEGDTEPMFNFYEDALGFEALDTLNISGGQVVWRFKAGDTQIKLNLLEDGRKYIGGGVTAATGLRLWTFFFSDEAAVVDRFVAAGLTAPKFEDLVGTDGKPAKRSALISDPSGQDVELVITGDAPDTGYGGVEIGMVVSDIKQSLEFYRGFVGFNEAEAEFDERFQTLKYSFSYGSTVITLRSFEEPLPADTGSGGVQYIVSNVRQVDELVKCRGITVERPFEALQGPSGISLTLWTNDPDGITNYFLQPPNSGLVS